MSEARARSMSRAERVAYLRANGWICIDSSGAQTWRSPDGRTTGTLAYCIRLALGITLRQSFGAWLSQQTERRDWVGDLARDYVQRCVCTRCLCRRRATTIQGVLADLERHNACDEAYEALDQAKGEWLATGESLCDLGKRETRTGR